VREALAVSSSGEIAILNDLVRATCHSADRCGAASRTCGGSYRQMVIEQLCEDRRLLLVDLIRCLLLRGVPVPEVRRAITLVPTPTLTVADLDVIWIDVEIAERKLHRALRQALEDPLLSEPVRELLSLHYLRVRLHHDELDGLVDDRPLVVEPATPEHRAYHA
jgi:hypothetical protein